MAYVYIRRESTRTARAMLEQWALFRAENPSGFVSKDSDVIHQCDESPLHSGYAFVTCPEGLYRGFVSEDSHPQIVCERVNVSRLI